jgi:succinate dehydrogenase/fumarate reductase-like Fe-S protein
MKITVARGSGAEETLCSYDLPDLTGHSVSTALRHIAYHIDSSVGYYLSCRRGLCACCVVRIDGKNVKACIVPVRDGMVIKRVKAEIVKDTVVHLGVDPAFHLAVVPFRPGDGSEPAKEP